MLALETSRQLFTQALEASSLGELFILVLRLARWASALGLAHWASSLG